MKRFCLALDLKNDSALIAEYKKYHEKIWPEITASIKEAGITLLEIYLIENRLFMIIEANDDFSFERKKLLDESNERVQAWEKLMWNYQQSLPTAKPGEKWMLMEKIFDLSIQ
ncbi:MAG TPA: L-fucose mutarotase [Cytophagales bacterium]|jgi:L-rhamnose mutarotase|nr:L-fucose mutarotase [Cytophagales bacterium]